MTAYYNEIDPFAAAWLRELINAGLIAPGDVDERSIVDVRATDLVGYDQCHFFAGIGGWSYALRLAGWPDDRPVWTGSCPCQPFSAAGKRQGKADERHLWPEFFRLIRECGPDTVFGEQVAAAIGLDWLDHVSDDLEGVGYAVGSIVLPACSVGAPHLRQRLWFVAESDRNAGGQGRAINERRDNRGDAESWAGLGGGELFGELADSNGRKPRDGHLQPGGQYGLLAQGGGTGELGHSNAGRRAQAETVSRGPTAISGLSGSSGELVQPRLARLEGHAGHGDDRNEPGRDGAQPCGSVAATGATRGFWHPADWLPCRDGKSRPVEPGTFPLAHGLPARVGRLRGYGNAIVPEVAAEVIRAYMHD